MKYFRVLKLQVVTVGAGEVLQITDAQIAPRKHNLDIVSRGDGAAFADVRPKVPVQFKAGEVFGLTDMPKYLADKIEEVADLQGNALPSPEQQLSLDQPRQAHARRR